MFSPTRIIGKGIGKLISVPNKIVKVAKSIKDEAKEEYTKQTGASDAITTNRGDYSL